MSGLVQIPGLPGWYAEEGFRPCRQCGCEKFWCGQETYWALRCCTCLPPKRGQHVAMEVNLVQRRARKIDSTAVQEANHGHR